MVAVRLLSTRLTLMTIKEVKISQTCFGEMGRSMTTTMNAKTFVLLDETEDGTVVIQPKNRDTFCMQVEEAVRACQLLDDSYSFVRQVGDLQEKLVSWLEANRDQIHSAFLTIRADGILFVVVQSKVERDDALVSSLTDLDLSIACDEMLDLIKLEVLSTPLASREALNAFMCTGQIIHAHENSSQSCSRRERESAEVPERKD